MVEDFGMNNQRQNLNMRTGSQPIIYSFFVGVYLFSFYRNQILWVEGNVTKDCTGFSMGFLATGS